MISFSPTITSSPNAPPGLEKAKKEVIRATMRVSDLLVNAVNGGVQEIFVNEKRIEMEIRALTATIMHFFKQTDQWLVASHAINNAIKVNHIHHADACKITPAKFSGSKEVVPLQFRKVDICCFDKTGTLTSDDMEFSGVGGLDDSEDLETEMSKVPDRTLEILASCHALVFVDNKLVGDPLEKAALKGIEWTYKSDEKAMPKKSI